MRKLLLLFIMAAICTTHAFAFGIFVPRSVKKAFVQKFPTVTKVKWVRHSGGELEANFVENDKEVNAYFTSDGALKKIDVEIRWVELPVQARKYVQENYKGCFINRLMHNADKGNPAPYIVEVFTDKKSHWMFFDKKGELVNIKK